MTVSGDDAGNDARPLASDGDNGMCDDNGLLRSWTLLDDVLLCNFDGLGGVGRGKFKYCVVGLTLDLVFIFNLQRSNVTAGAGRGRGGARQRTVDRGVFFLRP